MFEEQVYKQSLESLQAWAVKQNEFNREQRLYRCAKWLEDAAIELAQGRPKPPQPPQPAPIISIVTVPGSIDQSTISVVLGPGLVAYGADVVLPPIQGYTVADYPPGVCAPGYDYGDVMAALPQDTMPDGTQIELSGKKWQKIEGVWPFGRKSLYVLVIRRAEDE